MTSEASAFDWLTTWQALLRLVYMFVSRFHVSCQPGVSRALDVIENTEVNCVVFLYSLLNSA